MNGQPGTDERLLAALAHGSIVANGLWGAWQTWRGKPFRYALIGRWLKLT